MARKRKAAKVAAIVVRFPLAMKRWIEQQAQHYGASQNSAILRAVRAAMDAERREGRSA